MAEPLTPEERAACMKRLRAGSFASFYGRNDRGHDLERYEATVRALEADRDDFELALRHAIADKAIDGGASLDNVDPGTGMGIYLSKLAALESENTRLRVMIAGYESGAAENGRERARVEAENARLREALETIGGCLCARAMSGRDCATAGLQMCTTCIARRALGDPDHA